MALGSMDDFLAVLERSKLLNIDKFAEVQRLALETSDYTSLAKTLVRQEILTRWQAGQLLAGRSKCTVGKYKLLDLLGRGGMGSVYLGEHVMMNRRVAIKIIPRHIGKNPAGLERFLAEARTIAALDHPNIVQAYSVDNEGDQYYLVMEYVEGLDLQRLVEAEGPLDCASTVDYMRQAADGLAHAHNRKMVHCDIKPSNLIVNPQGVVKILDMGLARLAGQEQAGEDAGEQDSKILGTVDYMAPEQALGTSEFDHRADIYSLGCTLYFLLTGSPPFPEGTLPERILKHQTQEPRSISAERSDVPHSLIEICKKMMAIRPADRYQTAAEVSQMLTAWRPGEKRVQRVLQLKKAEPIDDLPGPDLLGSDLSDLFPKGMGVSATNPIIGRKSQPSRLDKLPPLLRPLLSTPLRAIITAGITVAVAVLLIVALINMVISNNNVVTTTMRPDERSATTKPPKGNGSTAKQTDVNIQQPDVKNQNEGTENTPNSANVAPSAPPGDKTLSTEITTTQTQQQEKTTEKTQQKLIPPSEPPKSELFKDLAASVDLPEINESSAQENTIEKTVSLGKVLLPKDASLQLVLIGGVKAVKNTDSIVMKNDISARQSPLWQIYVETASNKQNKDTPRRIEIARMKLTDGNLLFTWMPGATSDYAEALKKCGMLAFLSGQRQFVQLCRPRLVEPLALDMDKGIADVSLSMESLPELGKLRVQIKNREGALPPNTLQPSDILEVPSEGESDTAIIFTDPKFAYFKVKITAEMNGQKLDLKATAIYEFPGQDPKTFKANDALKLLNNLLRQQGPLQKTFDNAPDGSQRKREAARKLDPLKKQIDFLEDLNGIYQPLKGTPGKIHYSVFIVYGKYNKVELFNTQAHVVKPVEVKDAN
jgi:serine/threonine protein kinase